MNDEIQNETATETPTPTQPAEVQAPAPEEAPAATVAAPSAPAVNDKQSAKVALIEAGIAARNLGEASPKFEQIVEGSDLFLVADNWPTIKIGKAGGVVVSDLRSYPETDGHTATEAAINGDVLLAKQNERDRKRAAAKVTPPTPTASVPAPAVEEQVEVEDEPAFATGQPAAEDAPEVEESAAV